MGSPPALVSTMASASLFSHLSGLFSSIRSRVRPQFGSYAQHLRSGRSGMRECTWGSRNQTHPAGWFESGSWHVAFPARSQERPSEPKKRSDLRSREDGPHGGGGPRPQGARVVLNRGTLMGTESSVAGLGVCFFYIYFLTDPKMSVVFNVLFPFTPIPKKDCPFCSHLAERGNKAVGLPV